MPICGIETAIRSCVVSSEELTERLLHVVGLRQDGLLERRAERDRHVGRGQPPDRRVEMLEGVLGDERGDLGADPARSRRLVGDEHLAGLPGGREDRVGVERAERSQVEHLDVLAQLVGSVERKMHARAVGDDAHV